MQVHQMTYANMEAVVLEQTELATSVAPIDYFKHVTYFKEHPRILVATHCTSAATTIHFCLHH